MSLIKIPFIISSAIAVYSAISPPHHPEAEEKLKPTGAEHMFGWAPVVQKALFWSCEAVEVAVILAYLRSSSPISLWVLETFVPGPTPTLLASHIKITSMYLIGFVLLISGAFIRLSCYNLLGRLFTFELSIRKDHKLITSGPYSVVRHPSYTGAVLSVAGIALCHTGEGSWVNECTSKGGLFQVLAWLWVVSGVFVIIVRMRKEDDMLKKEFGKEWEEWRNTVPCKIFPGVY